MVKVSFICRKFIIRIITINILKTKLFKKTIKNRFVKVPYFVRKL